MRFRAPLAAFAAAVLFLLAAAPASAESDPTLLRLKVGEFDPLRGVPALSEGLRLPAEPESGIFVVQFGEAIRPALLERAERRGAELLEYLPERAYAVRLAPGGAAALRALPEVRWVAAVEPGWKLSPDLGTRPYADPSRREGGILRVTADLWPGEDPERAAAAAAATGADVLQVVRFGAYARLRIHATIEQAHAVARLPAVSFLEEMAEITPRNNTTRWVIQSDLPDQTPIWDRGLHGEGQIIGHIDGRIDMNSCYIRDPSNNTPGPDHRKVVAYRSNSGQGSDSHGTHTAGTSAGDQFPLNGTINNNGNAYAAKISHSNLNDINGSGTAPSNLYTYLSSAHGDGARTHTNSWGDDGTTQYTTWCVDIDRFSYDFEDSLVFFAVTNTSTLRTPENAKNVVAVGASQNGLSNDNFCSGGRGPTNDGRRKPEIFAPGCSIVSAGNSLSCGTKTFTGTSMACPAVTAAGSIVRQYFEEGWYPTGTKSPADARVPSGALVKATLTNTSVDMTGISGFPSNQEGWGRVLLENALFFEGDVRKLSLLDDVRNANGLTTGQSATYDVVVEGSGEPLKVTAAWTEPAASLLANPATVNDLDLEVVSPSGDTYLGNVFDTALGRSSLGGTPDAKNNVEQVVIEGPAVGTWTVRIRGTAVNQGTQGYAVVASGEVKPAGGGALRYASHQVQDAAPLGNADGVLDPGETATIPVDLKNASQDPVTGIAGALRSDRPDLVRITREGSTWPDLAPDATGTSFAPHAKFTLAPSAACGTRIQFRVEATSSAGEGSIGFLVEVGKTGVAKPAPGLPLTIPKKSTTGVSSTLQVDETFTIRNLTVDVDVQHGEVGELVLQLRSPIGTTVTLHNKTRAGQADVVANFDVDRQPDGPGTMNDFDGQQAQGTWTLVAVDDVGGPTPAGAIRAWTLRFEATAPISCAPLSCGEPVPGNVGTTLVVSREGADGRLEWSAVAGASSYRVWRASLPDFSDETLAATVSGTSYVDAGAAGTAYYRVRAINACEWEGP